MNFLNFLSNFRKKSLNVRQNFGLLSDRRDYNSQTPLSQEDYFSGWNYIAQNKIASAMANSEFLYKNSQGNIQENRIFIDLMKKPSKHQNFDDFIYLCGMYLMGTYGFAPIVLDRIKNPTEILVLPPQSFIGSDGVKYRVNYSVNGSSVIKEIPVELVKILKKPSLSAIDEAQGISAFLSDSIKLEKRAKELMESSFLNRGRLGTYLTTNDSFSAEVLDRLEEKLNSKQRGTKKSFLTRIFDKGLKVHESNINNKDLESISVGDKIKEQILSAYSISDIILGRENSSSNATALVAYKNFYTQAVFPENRKIVNILTNEILPLFSDYKKGDHIDFSNDLELDPEIKARVGKAEAEKLRALTQVGYTMRDDELNELGFVKIKTEEIKEEVDKVVEEEPKKEEIKEEEEIKEGVKEEKAEIKEKSMAIKIIETEEIYHQKKLSFASTLEEKAKNKLKTFFNKARKVDKSFNNDEEQTLVDEYIMLMLPIYIKAIKEQMRLLNQSRGLEELLDDELITKEAEKQAEKSAKQIVETLSKETKELNNEDKEEYYNNRDNKIEQIAINEVHTAIGISTLEMFNKNKVPYKKWVTFGDERVCQFCRPMDGVLIKSGENYWNANETMIGLEGGTLSFDYAPVSYSQLHVECRCSLVDVYEKPDKFIDYKGTNKMLEISKKIDSGFEMLKTENKKLKEESLKKEKELVDIINNL